MCSFGRNLSHAYEIGAMNNVFHFHSTPQRRTILLPLPVGKARVNWLAAYDSGEAMALLCQHTHRSPHQCRNLRLDRRG